MLRQVRMVLVEPSHPGNIGAAARAMKTMGLSQLALVSPKHFPSAEATARASGADDLLHAARIGESLDEVIADCGTVFGTTARARRLETRVLHPRACADHAFARLRASAEPLPVAIVFGREHSGLSNAELDRCHALVRIPTAANFSSLNIAAAVQILAYEILEASKRQADSASPSASKASAQPPFPLPRGESLASASELQGFYRHLESVLVEIGYLDPKAPGLLMRRLRRIFNRAEIQASEINILRGILTAAKKAASPPTSVAGSAESSTPFAEGGDAGEDAGDGMGESAGEKPGQEGVKG
ncbi:MAG: RNA methyltransferase [Ectothiorhodospiraceae bacterium AqS1]|nr:RNA methyltransferase [Ectothiorhodospiraceae bacterium AqS1]